MVWYRKCRELIFILLITVGLIVYGALRIIFTNNGVLRYNANGVWYASALIAIGIIFFLYGVWFLFSKIKTSSAPIHPLMKKKKLKNDEVIDTKKVILSLCGLCIFICISVFSMLIIGGKFELSGPSINDVIFGISGIIYIITSLCVVFSYDYICYKIYKRNKV